MLVTTYNMARAISAINNYQNYSYINEKKGWRAGTAKRNFRADHPSKILVVTGVPK